MEQMLGTQSLRYAEACYILASASVVGKKEGEGPLGNCFDMICEDDKFGQENWEKAESQLQKEALTLALGKAGVKKEDLRYLFAGDLLGQNMATSFGLLDFQVPLFGLYGACSTAGESLSLASMCVAGGFAELVGAVTSSHFASAEKQFRYPLEYANQRPLSATWTVTGGGAYILGKKKKPGADCRYYHRADCGLRHQGFHEYGGGHGAGCRRPDRGASERFFGRSRGV